MARRNRPVKTVANQDETKMPSTETGAVPSSITIAETVQTVPVAETVQAVAASPASGEAAPAASPVVSGAEQPAVYKGKKRDGKAAAVVKIAKPPELVDLHPASNGDKPVEGAGDMYRCIRSCYGARNYIAGKLYRFIDKPSRRHFIRIGDA